MKSFILTILSVMTVATMAFAQDGGRRGPGRDRDRDRDNGRNRDRVTCAIYTPARGTAVGEGRNCRQALAMAEQNCTRMIAPRNQYRCYEAGERGARFQLQCEEGRGRNARPIRCK